MSIREQIDNFRSILDATAYRRAVIVIMSLLILYCFAMDIFLGLWQYHDTTLTLFYSVLLFATITVFVFFIIILSMTPLRNRIYAGILEWDFVDIGLSILYVFMILNFFSSLKSIIPFVNWYWMDEWLIKAERFVHFGILPTDLFYQHGRPMWLFDLSLDFYIGWFFVFYLFLVGMIFSFGPGPRRQRFLIAFGLCWLLIGIVLATLCASAGPAFMRDIYGDMRFAEYEEWFMLRAGVLATTKSFCADITRYWPIVDYNAVSAMPSMHVAIAALITFYVRDYHPRFIVPAVIFLVMIQVGCIVLLMHYAIDGYVSVLATWLIWRWCRRFDQPIACQTPSDKGTLIT